MNNIKVTVYCASSSKCNRYFLESAYEFGSKLAKNKYDIIYGGGKAGLMGQVADGSLDHGGYVTGVIPDFMIDLELEHTGVQQLIKVRDMHQRQSYMEFESNACVALPGGSGTFLELFESISFKRLGLIISPIIIVNLNRYYDPLIEMLDRAIREKFMSEGHYKLWHVTNSIDETIDYLLEKLPPHLLDLPVLPIQRYMGNNYVW